MLNIKQFRYGSDNLAYLVYAKKNAMAIDGGAWQEITGFLDSRNLTLAYVTNTHDHADHTPGNKKLLSRTGAAFLSFRDLADGRGIVPDGESVKVMRTPGHSGDSVCFYTGTALISGDTLFNGTIGNCFSGDIKGYMQSIKRIMALPPETVIYAGHDYVRDSLAFAEYIDPGNPYIAGYRKMYSRDNLHTALSDELKVNPYLRFNEDSMKKILMERGLPHDTEWDRWRSILSIT